MKNKAESLKVKPRAMADSLGLGGGFSFFDAGLDALCPAVAAAVQFFFAFLFFLRHEISP